MLSLIWVMLFLAFIAGSLGERFWCIIRDNNFIPTCVVELTRCFLDSKVYCILKKKEFNDSIGRILSIIMVFLILSELIKMQNDWGAVLFLALQIFAIYKLITLTIIRKIRKKFLVLVFFCLVNMIINVWANSVMLLTDFLMANNIDGAIICVNVCMSLTIMAVYFFYCKWNNTLDTIGKQFLWNVLFVLSVILVSFAFGMLNLVYSALPSGIDALVEKIQTDSTLLYFGRMVYSGVIPAIYGKDVLKSAVSQSNMNLGTVYDKGMAFSYDELIFLNEAIFMAGNLYIGYMLRPLTKSHN